MGIRILVTGATGFIGSRVAAAAAAHPDLDHVRLLVRAPDPAEPAAAGPGRPGRPAVETVRGDLRDPASLRRACAGADAVVHCASAIGGGEETLRAVNEHGTRDLVDAAVRAGVRRIVALGTASVHGRGPFRAAAPDALPLAPVSATSRSRAAGERYVRDAGGTVLRPHLVYGTGDRYVVPGLLLLLAALPGPLARTGTLHSAVEAGSLGDALLGAALSPATRPGAYGLSHPDPVSDAELTAALEPLLPERVRASRGPAVGFAEARALLAGNPVAAHHLEMFGLDHWFADERPWTDFGRGPGPGFTAAFPRHLDWYRRLLAARG
ncbi:NAD-dependent epimerase/dehydratase family protein [Streptomyces filamentosus]|uniref:NAD-dependent epimerase/dehydratase family protein n=1 Tax=Streptomyces filamentosus TaxID=67294 RepID=UPI00123B0079|nr:NAD-dependent epimerase/dehydratase family protein [Streptomyces filamentosus]KAA6211411.1 NAD-dependent epimerase/dehydratase family protein [Streptomyces filamentosus]